MITVDEMMSTGVQTLPQSASLADAQQMMAKFGCRHIPIIEEGGHLTGLVSHRDVLAAADSSLLPDGKATDPSDVLISDFMNEGVFSVNPGTSLRKAAMYMRNQRYGCLPIVENGALVGIITDSDFVNIAIDLLEQLEEAGPPEDD
jgi:CBS domain-containing membrane protein